MKKTNLSFLKVITLSIIIQFLSFQVSFGQSKSQQIDKLIELYHNYGQFNGTVLVAEKGKIIYKKGFGMANMEWQIPNQTDTKLRLGSITKQFTAMLILQLVEQGKLKLDVPITTYLPNYPKTSGDKITLHHLLTHSSGIPNYTSFPNFRKEVSLKPYTPEAFLSVFSNLPLDFNPGEKFSYSNSGYFLLGYIIEKTTNKSYEQCLQENIFNPLKMVNTGYDNHNVILKNRAAGYEKNGENYINAPYLDMSIPYAAGSMYSTVEDLYLWDQALYTEKLLSSKYKELMFEKHIKTGSGNYGYGWNMYEKLFEKSKEKISMIQHGGGINGFNTLISRIPADKNLIVLLNNTGQTLLDEMNNSIRAILYNMPYDLPKKSTAMALLNISQSKGVQGIQETFKTLEKDGNYKLKENEMNSVGYQLLQSGKIKEAIEIFKINVNAFPTSGNAYDSLGEAYLSEGNKILALENYKKSVALDPTNENGKKIILEISK
jgi:CubicO group peptidase (beta-lactamase class C family)